MGLYQSKNKNKKNAIEREMNKLEKAELIRNKSCPRYQNPPVPHVIILVHSGKVQLMRH